MDERITLRTYTASSNYYGEETLSTNVDTTVFAKVEYLNFLGKEKTTMQEVVFDKVKFSFRYPGITFNEKANIIFENNTYDIINIAKLGRNKYFEVVTTRVH